jgi:hypothetical protein
MTPGPMSHAPEPVSEPYPILSGKTGAGPFSNCLPPKPVMPEGF